jgi:hypothetical protein
MERKWACRVEIGNQDMQKVTELVVIRLKAQSYAKGEVEWDLMKAVK